MRSRRGGLWIAGAIATGCLWTANAGADEVEGPGLMLPEPEAPAVEPAAPAAFSPPATPEPGYRDASITNDDWNARRPWRYGTQYLMPLTRGMGEAGIPKPARWPLYLLTLPFDVVQLPFGAIAGLFGS